jgi:hypothetical protein
VGDDAGVGDGAGVGVAVGDTEGEVVAGDGGATEPVAVGDDAPLSGAEHAVISAAAALQMRRCSASLRDPDQRTTFIGSMVPRLALTTWASPLKCCPPVKVAVTPSWCRPR